MMNTMEVSLVMYSEGEKVFDLLLILYVGH